MGGNGNRFKVVYPGNVRAALKQLCLQAKNKGLAKTTLEALQLLDQSLINDPLNFGDPWSRYGNLRVFHRILPPFDVVYAVHITKPIVFVRTIRPFPRDYFAT